MFSISAITWHDIQQLSINLPQFTHFFQLMNCQNISCKFVKKFAIDLKKNNLYYKMQFLMMIYVVSLVRIQGSAVLILSYA